VTTTIRSNRNPEQRAASILSIVLQSGTLKMQVACSSESSIPDSTALHPRGHYSPCEGSVDKFAVRSQTVACGSKTKCLVNSVAQLSINREVIQQLGNRSDTAEIRKDYEPFLNPRTIDLRAANVESKRGCLIANMEQNCAEEKGKAEI
jgi:hypothetical protein